MQVPPGIRQLVERQRREATVPSIGRGSEGTGTLAERCDCSITLRKTRNALGTYTLLPWRRGAQQSGMSRFGSDAVKAGGIPEDKTLGARTVEHVWFAGAMEGQAWLRRRSALTAPQVERLFAVADGWGRHGMPLATRSSLWWSKSRAARLRGRSTNWPRMQGLMWMSATDSVCHQRVRLRERRELEEELGG